MRTFKSSNHWISCIKFSLLMRHPADIAGNQPHLWLSPKRDEPSRRKLAINIYFSL